MPPVRLTAHVPPASCPTSQGLPGTPMLLLTWVHLQEHLPAPFLKILVRRQQAVSSRVVRPGRLTGASGHPQQAAGTSQPHRHRPPDTHAYVRPANLRSGEQPPARPGPHLSLPTEPVHTVGAHETLGVGRTASRGDSNPSTWTSEARGVPEGQGRGPFCPSVFLASAGTDIPRHAPFPDTPEEGQTGRPRSVLRPAPGWNSSGTLIRGAGCKF